MSKRQQSETGIGEAMDPYVARQAEVTRHLSVKSLRRARVLLGIGVLLFCAGMYLAVPKLADDPLHASSLLLVAVVTVNLMLAWQRHRVAKQGSGC